MSSQFNITDATRQWAYNKCTPLYSPTSYGQIKYAISCLPSNATSTEGIGCADSLKLPSDMDCATMISGGWNKYTKRQEAPYYCYTLCQEFRNNAAVGPSANPSIVAKTSPSAAVNSSASAAPTASPSSHSAALTVSPNFALSFFTLLFFMFVFFKPKN